MGKTSKSILLASSCGLALSLQVGAAAAQQASGGTHDWSGYYGGIGLEFANTGVAWSTDYGGAYGGELDLVPSLTFGRNWQDGNVVLGIEGSFTHSGQAGMAELYDDDEYMGLYDWHWAASVRGRAGIATGPLLTFATAGLTLAELELTGCEDLPCPTDNYTIYAREQQLGVTIGFGMEYALSRNSSIRAEYLYTAFPSLFSETNEAGVFTEPGDLSTDAHAIRLSYNYFLGGGGRDLPNGLEAPSRGWDGAYVGAFALGGLVVDDATNIFYASNRAYSEAAGLGASFGYNWQSGNFVYGVVGDIATGALDSDSYWADDYYKFQEWDWLATLRGRAGVATGDLLLYGTAGIAFADMRIGVCDNTVGYTGCVPGSEEGIYDGVNAGLTAGFGVEFAASERLSFVGEYNFVGFPAVLGDREASGAIGDATEHTTAAHFLRVGVNYSLGGGRQMSEEPLHDWTGAYAGASFLPNLQYLSAGVYDGGTTGSEFAVPVGLTAGQNWQAGNFVWGIEGDIFTGGNSTRIQTYDLDYVVHSEWNWSASLRGRAGIATGAALLYATGGVAIADITAWSCDSDTNCNSVNDSDVDSAIDGTLMGLVAGLGVEYALTDNISAVAEYRYTGFPSEYGSDIDYPTDFTNYRHGVRLGINYRF